MQAALTLSPAPIDSARFTELIETHHRGLFSYAVAVCRSEEVARELVQDAFVAAWQGMATFDVTRDFAAWLRGIVRNKWRERYRLRTREVELDEATLSLLEETLSPYSASDDALFEHLAECRDKLPGLMKEAVMICYDEGRSGDEASQLLSLSPATFRKRLERAREALRNCLSGNV